MAHAETTLRIEPAGVQLGTLAPRMITVGAVLAVVGLGVAAALGFSGGPEARKVFFHAYLVGFVFFLSITLGALFFVLLHHLTRAGWSVTLRRLAEGLAGNIGLLVLLFVPLVPALAEIYEWTRPGALVAAHVSPAKAAYLSIPWFVARFALYFAVWGFLAWYFRSRSVRQDLTGNLQLSTAMERVSTFGMVAFGFTATFASFDLLMSLNPHWFSTIFGVYFFAGCVLSFLVVLTLLALWLQRHGRLTQAITTEHYHDLGKLTFTFVFFWGYIAFSQYMLTWYAGLPEETQFFLPRQLGPWAWVGLTLLVCHLLIPFAGLLGRNAKRHRGIFTFWAIWLLAAHALDLFWLVMPNLYIHEIPAAVGDPTLPLSQALPRLVTSTQAIYTVREAGFMAQVMLPFEPRSLAMVAGVLVGMAGLYVASTAWLLKGAALVPLQDPRLPEALAFENV